MKTNSGNFFFSFYSPFFQITSDALGRQGWPTPHQGPTNTFIHIVVLFPIFNHSCHSAVVPRAPGVVTQIINTLLFLLSAHQSSSQSNILITALPLMLLRSGTNSLMMCAVQLQLPPSERSLKPVCKSISPIASPVTLCLLGMTWLCPRINVNCLDLCSVAS